MKKIIVLLFGLHQQWIAKIFWQQFKVVTDLIKCAINFKDIACFVLRTGLVTFFSVPKNMNTIHKCIDNKENHQ